MIAIVAVIVAEVRFEDSGKLVQRELFGSLVQSIFTCQRKNTYPELLLRVENS